MKRVVRERRADVEIGDVVLIADLAEELLDAARIVLGPARIVLEMTRRVEIDAIALSAVFEQRILAAERSARELDRRTGILRATLRVDGERAAQRIQPERGNRSGNQLHGGDR